MSDRLDNRTRYYPGDRFAEDIAESDDLLALMEPSGDLRVLRDEMTGHELFRYVAESE